MKILAQSSWWTVNKQLAKLVGIEASLLLSDLCDKYEYRRSRGELVEYKGPKDVYKGKLYFYCTSELIEDSTTLGYKAQKRCIAELEKYGFILCVLTGTPAKLHFTICENKIMQFINSSFTETAKLDLPKGQINNNKEIINNNKIVSKDTTPIGEVGDGSSDFENSLEILPPPVPLAPPVIVEQFGKSDVNNIIDTVKSACKEVGIIYQSGKNERMRAQNMLQNKFKTEALEQVGMGLEEFIRGVILVSSKIKYGKVINSVESLFYNWGDTINKAKQQNMHIQTEKKKIVVLR